MNVEIDLDKLNYHGVTRSERRLNRELLETILELNLYQDSYDQMRTVDEIKSKIETIELALRDEYIPESSINSMKGELSALKWVLNNSRTVEEKEQALPKASKEIVSRLVKNYNERYKQMTIDDFLEGDSSE